MFDDIYRTRARMAAALQVVHGDQTADHGVEDAFEYLVALLVQNGGIGHQMADLAHEQQRASVQRLRVALEISIGAVLVQGAGEGLAAFVDFFGKIALHQPKPVAIGADFIPGVDSGDGVREIDDGGQGGFHQNIFDAGAILLAYRVRRIDLKFEVQAVVAEHNGLRRIGLAAKADRSEEHTSELQSLMRIPYAVFCLKTQKTT